MLDNLSRRQFVQEGRGHGRGAGLGPGSGPHRSAGNPTGADTSKILNYNPDMEYRRWARRA